MPTYNFRNLETGEETEIMMKINAFGENAILACAALLPNIETSGTFLDFACCSRSFRMVFRTSS